MIYATMDAIDTFKVVPLDNMVTTIGTLETEVAKSRSYLDRVQRQDQRHRLRQPRPQAAERLMQRPARRRTD